MSEHPDAAPRSTPPPEAPATFQEPDPARLLSEIAAVPYGVAASALLRKKGNFDDALQALLLRHAKVVIVMNFCSNQQNYFSGVLRDVHAKFFPSLPETTFDTVEPFFVAYDDVARYLPEKEYKRFIEEQIQAQAFEDIVGIFSGGDGSVPMADFANATLVGTPSLLGNNLDLSEARRDKVLMQSAIEAAGLRHIRTFCCATAAEAAQALDPEQNDAAANANFFTYPVIVKPVTGAGSEFICLCHTAEDVEVAYSVAVGLSTTQSTTIDAMCVQEYIEGDEFVVDVVSYEGRHVVTDVWRSYKYPFQVVSNRLRHSVDEELKAMKIPRSQRDTTTLVYDRLDFVDNIERGGGDQQLDAVIDYSLKCIDALHFRNGCTHLEVRCDKNGPVLIELNPRMQGDVPRSTDFVGYDQYVLLAYLIRVGSKRLSENSAGLWPPPGVPERYNCVARCAGKTRRVVFLFVQDDGVVSEIGRNYVMNMKTFVKFTRASIVMRPDAGRIHRARKTTDLFSCPGAVVLEGTKEEIDIDAQQLRLMENNRLESLMPQITATVETMQDWRRLNAERERLVQEDTAGLPSSELGDADRLGRLNRLNRLRQELHAVHKCAVDERNDLTRAIEQQDPPALFVLERVWELLRSGYCGECMGAKPAPTA